MAGFHPTHKVKESTPLFKPSGNMYTRYMKTPLSRALLMAEEHNAYEVHEKTPAGNARRQPELESTM